jgi:hypothetical protein
VIELGREVKQAMGAAAAPVDEAAAAPAIQPPPEPIHPASE